MSRGLPIPRLLARRGARRCAPCLAALRGLLALLAVSCGGEPPPPEAGARPEENAIEQTKARGPVELVLRVEPRTPTFADRIHFTITSRAEPGVEVRLPRPGESLGQFLIKDFLDYPARETADGRRERRQSYVLEVLTSGKYTIPATTTTFVVDPAAEKTAEGGEEAGEGPEEDGEAPPAAGAGEGSGGDHGDPEDSGREYTIVSEPIEIEVAGLKDPVSVDDLRPIAGPVSPPALPASLRWPLLVGGAVLGILLLATGLVVVLRRERRPAPPPALPPEELAYRDLEWLVTQGFAERGELVEFYFHLSRIVREYIERRFGLRAPEETTEEFLAELTGSDHLEERHKQLLHDFLEKADLVKFARYAPAPQEIEASFEAAKRFIGETVRPAGEVSHGVE